jgi:hypothetical protein
MPRRVSSGRPQTTLYVYEDASLPGTTRRGADRSVVGRRSELVVVTTSRPAVSQASRPWVGSGAGVRLMSWVVGVDQGRLRKRASRPDDRATLDSAPPTGRRGR